MDWKLALVENLPELVDTIIMDAGVAHKLVLRMSKIRKFWVKSYLSL